jgi:hypothetical protein
MRTSRPHGSTNGCQGGEEGGEHDDEAEPLSFRYQSKLLTQ